MTIKSEPLTKRRGLSPLLSRDHLDRAGPWLRAAAGLILIGYTGYTTVIGFGNDFAPLLTGAIYGIPVQLLAGVAAAIFISVVQWLTSEHYQLIYAIFLLIDARYTQRQIGPAIETLADYHMAGLDSWIASGVSLVVSWGSALFAARYGEILLFGKRKRPKKTEEA